MNMSSRNISAPPVRDIVLPFIDAAADVLPAEDTESIREDFEAGEVAVALSQAAAALVDAGVPVDRDLLNEALSAGFPAHVERWLHRL